jgi:lipopolysaccharide transport system ATP-binding protein
MEEISKGGTTIIYISHNIPSVISLCPRSILLKKGNIEKEGPSREVCRHYYKSYSSTMMATETYQLKVNDLSIYSQEGESATSFNTGEWASLEFSVVSSMDIQGLSMGFFIRREDGMVVFDGTSGLMEGKTFNFTEGRAEKVGIKYRNNLPNGTYFLGIHFWKDGEGFYYYDDEIMEVYINSPQTSGSAFLDVKW